jgi:hypothetical protein
MQLREIQINLGGVITGMRLVLPDMMVLKNVLPQTMQRQEPEALCRGRHPCLPDFN